MSTRSSRTPPSSKLTQSQLSAALYRHLETAFDRQCDARYDADVALDRVEASAGEVTMCVECKGLTHMPVHLTTAHAGGNVYDVTCSVDGGDSHRFSYSLPGAAGAQLSCMAHVSEEVATFLREELERWLGRVLLQRSSPPRSAPRADG